MTVIQVVAAMTTALIAWSLVDAPSLLHGAETAPRGARRTAALDVLRPLARVSAALGIDRVSHVADDILHRHTPSASGSAPLVVTVPPATPPLVGTRPTPHVTPTTVPGLPPLRIGTAADPLRVLVIGDSLGLSFGYGMANKLDAGGIVKTTVDAREGTGLTRPDAFDWAAEVRSDIVQFHPELVVAMFGGNDDQDTIVNGRFIPFGSQEWTVIYGARVAGVAATVRSSGAHLLWAGLPVMRSTNLSQRLQAVMAVTRAALSGRDGAAFVDNFAALGDGSGHYTVAVPGSGGQEVIVREPDGVHVTPAGADRLADRALAEAETSWHLVVRPPAASP
jgi:lysophospholipase L1-like esterase